MAGSAGKDERERLDAGGLAASIATLLFSLPALGVYLILPTCAGEAWLAWVRASKKVECCGPFFVPIRFLVLTIYRGWARIFVGSLLHCVALFVSLFVALFVEHTCSVSGS